MDYDNITFWLVALSCLSGMAVALPRLRSVGPGWAMLFLIIFLVSLAGRLSGRNSLIYAAALLWLCLVLIPGLLGKLFHRLFLQQKYPAAYPLARIISWLHPLDGWRSQPEMVRAFSLVQKGDVAGASEILERYQDAKTLIGISAVINLFRITHRWEELLAWQAQRGQELEKYPQVLPALLRARGETGDLRGLIELYDRNKDRIGRMIPASSRDLCRLLLFAFCGNRASAEGLFKGSLAMLPRSIREFWLATADLAAGRPEVAKREFERLLSEADPSLRRAIERRLSNISTAPLHPGEPSAQSVIASAALHQTHDEKFGARPSLFSRRALATQILLALNLVMFAGEIYLGGSDDPQALYRLGALFAPAVHAGQWWRLIASLFLHWGPVHLAMNMVGLWLLAPFCELSLGFWRFLLVYLSSGIGSMGLVLFFASRANGDQLTVGASGCVMGLIGATAALMLRGWLRDKALSARRRLGAMLAIVAMQTLFDAMVPQVSMTAHLSGVVIGFVAATVLPDRGKNLNGNPATIN